MPLSHYDFFHHYFALLNMKIKCKSQVFKNTAFIPIPFFYVHNKNFLLLVKYTFLNLHYSVLLKITCNIDCKLTKAFRLCVAFPQSRREKHQNSWDNYNKRQTMLVLFSWLNHLFWHISQSKLYQGTEKVNKWSYWCLDNYGNYLHPLILRQLMKYHISHSCANTTM